LIGSRIKALRLSKDLTQAKLGEALLLSQQTIDNYENRGIKPPADTLIKLADFFDVSVDYLLGRTENPQGMIEVIPVETAGERVSTFALSRSDNPDADLPEEAQKQIEDFRAYIRQKHKMPD